MNSNKVQFYEISQEMMEKLNEIDNAGNKRGPLFTKEQEAIIVKFYPIKNKEQLAEFFGVNVSTLRRHYQRLTRNAETQK